MNKFYEKLQEKIMIIGQKVGSQLHMSALKDAFALILPITLMGSFALILLKMPITGYEDFLNNLFGSSLWKTFLESIYNLTIPLTAFLLVISLSYQMARRRETEVTVTILVTSIIFLMMLPTANVVTETGNIIVLPNMFSNEFMGSKGLFMSLILGFLVPELLSLLLKTKKLVITLPESVPPAVFKSFQVMIPAFITVVLFGGINFIIKNVMDETSAFNLVYDVLQAPLSHLGSNFFTILLMVFIINLAWIFGIHGPNLTNAITDALWKNLIIENSNAYVAGEAIPHFFSGNPFVVSYSRLGGSGNTLAIVIIALFILKKSRDSAIVKVGATPSMFNINEPLIFGLPIVLNPILAIPFLVAPMVTFTIAYFVTKIGLVAPIVVDLPWSTPPIISGYLGTGGDIKASILQIILLAISVLIYLPFLKMHSKVDVNDANTL
ncbi:PTS sugar transporter subunit IIC [Clostridium paraputrificum]|uniref:PTS sugar transporter subunit IIC n=1 Tax=Clostridium paraputrificum TaxID=29363 RepID=UPI003D33E4E5